MQQWHAEYNPKLGKENTSWNKTSNDVRSRHTTMIQYYSTLDGCSSLHTVSAVISLSFIRTLLSSSVSTVCRSAWIPLLLWTNSSCRKLPAWQSKHALLIIETKTYFCNDPNNLIYFISRYFINERKLNFSQQAPTHLHVELNVTILVRVILNSGSKAKDSLSQLSSGTSTQMFYWSSKQ